MKTAGRFISYPFCFIIITLFNSNSTAAIAIVPNQQQANKTISTPNVSWELPDFSDARNMEKQVAIHFKQSAINHQPSPSQKYL